MKKSLSSYFGKNKRSAKPDHYWLSKEQLEELKKITPPDEKFGKGFNFETMSFED